MKIQLLVSIAAASTILLALACSSESDAPDAPPQASGGTAGHIPSTGGMAGAQQTGGTHSQGGTAGSGTGGTAGEPASGGGGASAGGSAGTAGGSSCDQTGDCTECTECAIADVCSTQAQHCAAKSDCTDFRDCAYACGADAACQDQCMNAHYWGSVLYMDLFNCIYCQGCPADCGAPEAWECPSQDCSSQANCQDCVGCAAFGPCAASLSECAMDQNCVDYSDCSDACSDSACEEACRQEHIDGYLAFDEVVYCANCETCRQQCEGEELACGSPDCDNQGVCDECTWCAINADCRTLTLRCLATVDCNAYLDCVDPCGEEDPECVEACVTAHPQGKAMVVEIQKCLFCQECPNDCADHASVCE